MPGVKDISIYSGDSYYHELRIKNNSNAAINISNSSYSGTMKIARSSTDTVVAFTTNITDGANGVVLFSLTPQVTANIDPGTYVYDFQENNNGVITTLITGKAVVQKEVS